MIDSNLFNAKNIDRKARVIVPPKNSPPVKKNAVSDNAVRVVKAALIKGKELSIPMIKLRVKMDRSVVFKALRVLEDNNLILRVKRTGESGHPEAFVTLL